MRASSELNGIRAFSATSIWAVGETESGKPTGRLSSTLILHYNGRTWTRVPSPSPGKRGNGLFAVRPATGASQALVFHCC